MLAILNHVIPFQSLRWVSHLPRGEMAAQGKSLDEIKKELKCRNMLTGRIKIV
jgi:hypothetical protein